MEKRTILVPITIDRQFIEDVLCTAFEGGICYWCDYLTRVNDHEPSEEYHSEFVANGGTVLVHLDEGPIEDDGPDEYELDADKFCSGLQKFLVSQSGDGMLDVDAGNFDADMADCVVQYAIFGELVFG